MNCAEIRIDFSLQSEKAKSGFVRGETESTKRSNVKDKRLFTVIAAVKRKDSSMKEEDNMTKK